MIVDTLHNARLYTPIHPLFAAAFHYLESLIILPDERVSLDGDRMFVLFSQQQGKQKEEVFLEAHKKYIDIHFCFEGSEEIGWRSLDRCLKPDAVRQRSRLHDIRIQARMLVDALARNVCHVLSAGCTRADGEW